MWTFLHSPGTINIAAGHFLDCPRSAAAFLFFQLILFYLHGKELTQAKEGFTQCFKKISDLVEEGFPYFMARETWVQDRAWVYERDTLRNQLGPELGLGVSRWRLQEEGWVPLTGTGTLTVPVPLWLVRCTYTYVWHSLPVPMTVLLYLFLNNGTRSFFTSDSTMNP